MRDLEKLTANNILSISTPESLFTNSISEAKREYKRLARNWHPDSQPGTEALKVFLHIVELYGQARLKLSSGTWDDSCSKIEDQSRGIRRFILPDNSVKTCKYRVAHKFELGTVYLSENSVTFEIDNEFEELFERGRKRIHLLAYKDNAMAAELSKYLPQVKHEFRTSKSRILVIRKTPDQLLLSDVLKHFRGRLDKLEHVGWIVNSLLNTACYLEWSKLTHNAITASNVFISPLRHSTMLLGGWWYAARQGEKLEYIPEEMLPVVPPDVLRSKRADSRTDLDSIKSIARTLMGHRTGAHLASDKSLPPELVNWLETPSAGSALEDYKSFKQEILPSAFGQPRFVEMHLDANELYKEI